MRFLCLCAIGLLVSGAAPVRLAGQAPAPAACTSTAPEVRSADVIRVPIEITNNHVYIAVCAGSRPLHFLLDTGAGGVAMDLGIAKSLGAELKGSFEVRGAGAGSTAGASVRGQRVTLAGTRVTVDVKSAIDFKAMTPREGRPIEGILGYDFIKQFVVAIDYWNKELRLYPRAFKYEGTGVSVPITFNDNHPNIDASIRLADGDVVSGRFIVDVGASLALALVKPFVEKHRLLERTGKTVRRRGGGGVGGPSEVTLGRVAALKIGSVEIATPVTSMYGDAAGVFTSNPHWIGNIGGEILRRFTVYFDYDRKRMTLEPNPARDEPFEADMSGAGFMLGSDPGQLVVDAVLPGFAAAEAGLQRGDIVVEIDGQPVQAGSLFALRAKVRRDGETVALTVLRDGTRQTIKLTTRRII